MNLEYAAETTIRGPRTRDLSPGVSKFLPNCVAYIMKEPRAAAPWCLRRAPAACAGCMFLFAIIGQDGQLLQPRR